MQLPKIPVTSLTHLTDSFLKDSDTQEILEVIGTQVFWGTRPWSHAPIFNSENLGPNRKDDFHVNVLKEAKKQRKNLEFITI
jgi:hypothetical protein